MGSKEIEDTLESCPLRHKLAVFCLDKERRLFHRGRDKIVNPSVGAAGFFYLKSGIPQEFPLSKIKV